MNRRQTLGITSCLLTIVAAPLAGADRPDTPSSKALPPHFTSFETVETAASPGGSFLIHFSRAGGNAVPSADVDGSGVPDFVELTAATYDEVATFYSTTLGMKTPVADDIVKGDNGGDARFDVYLVDFGGHADGAFRAEACRSDAPAQCAGYMVQENDFAGYGYPTVTAAIRTLASHEYFHAVQAAYHRDVGAVLSEGTAVWATEAFDASLDDLEWFTGGYLEKPERSLDQEPVGPVDPFAYGSGVFFQYLSERFGQKIVPELWAAAETAGEGQSGAVWIAALDELLRASYDTDFPVTFREFALWNLWTGGFANPERSYANGGKYAALSMKEVESPFQDDTVRMFYATARYFVLDPAGRDRVTVALVASAEEPDAFEDLSLFLTTRTGNVVAEPMALPFDGTPQSVDTSTVDHVVAIVVNTAMEGDARKPGLCFGDEAEVEACRIALQGEPVPPDTVQPEEDGDTSTPVPDMDGDESDVVQAGDAHGAELAVTAEAASSSGCSAGTPGRGPFVVLALICLALRMQRRRTKCL